MNKNFILFILATALVLLVLQARPVFGVNENSMMGIGPEIGERVRLQFRRDALGGAGDLPVPPTTISINGASVSIAGELVVSTEHWLCVMLNGRKHWVPREVVLLVEQLARD